MYKKINLEDATRFVGLRLSSFGQLESISKKLVIASPRTFISEDSETALHGWITRSTRVASLTDHTILYTSDIAALNNWLENVEAFLDEGTISYSPLVKKVSIGGDKYDQMEGRIPFRFPDKTKFRASFATPHLALSDGSIKINRSEFRPLFHVDLPLIHNVDLKLLHDIMAANPDTLAAFRDFLLEQLTSAQDAALGSEQLSKDCRRIERNIRSEIRKLNTTITTSRIKNLTALAGGIIATWTLALFCILRDQHEVLKVAGPGGAVWTLSSAYMEYLTGKMSLRDNPVYFLWLLGRCKK